MNTTRLCLVIGVVLATAGTSRADIGVIVNEPVGVLGFFKNAYKSIAFAPYWFFGGFREVAVTSMFYHQVLAV